MAKGKSETRRKTAQTVKIGGMVPLARGLWRAAFGGGPAGWHSFKEARAARGTGKALVHAADAATHAMTGYDPNLRKDGSTHGYVLGEAGKTVGLTVALPAVAKTQPGRQANRALVWVQRKILGLKTAVKL